MVYRTCGGLCDQVKRILAEHPEAEHHHIIKGDRLLSILAPLRSGRAPTLSMGQFTNIGIVLGPNYCFLLTLSGFVVNFGSRARFGSGISYFMPK
jgi:hypothetical protein